MFSFVVKEGDQEVAWSDNSRSGLIRFTEIKYHEAGTHYYTVHEVIPDGYTGGIIYSRAIVPVIVRVTEVNGELRAVAEYPEGPIVFTNYYDPTIDEAYVDLEGTKNLIGAEIKDGMFRFGLYENDKLLQVVSNQGNTISFPKIHYWELGEHSYTIREIPGTDTNMTYDTRGFRVDVSVVWEDGNLVAIKPISTEP